MRLARLAEEGEREGRKEETKKRGRWRKWGMGSVHIDAEIDKERQSTE